LRHVNADPIAAEFLGGVNRRAAAAERVEHRIAFLFLGWAAAQSCNYFQTNLAQCLSVSTTV